MHPKHNQHELAHVHRYAFARSVLKVVERSPTVDAACGIGYGAVLLNPGRRPGGFLGIDVDGQSLEYARARFGAHGTFVRGSVTDLPLADATVPALVSLETIEHVADPVRCIEEFARVLTADGVLVVSTPEPDAMRLFDLGQDNPFHLRQLTKDEFREALERRFSYVRYYGQTPIDVEAWRDRSMSLRNRIAAQAKEVDRFGLLRAAYWGVRHITWVDHRLNQYGGIDHSVIADQGEAFVVMMAACRFPRREGTRAAC